MTAAERPGDSHSALLSLREHRRLLRDGASVIIAAVVIAVIAAVAVSTTLPRRWTASATLYVGQSLTEPSFDYGGLLASQLLTPTYASLATASDLLEAVAEDLGIDERPETLAQRIEASAPPGGTLITIRGTAATPEEAASLTNAVAEELLTRAPAARADQAELEEALRQLDEDVEATRATLLELLAQPAPTDEQRATATQLQQRLEALESTRSSLTDELATRSPNALTLVEQARPPQFPAGPSRTIIVGTAGFTALAAAVFFVYAFAGVRRSWAEHRQLA